MTTTTDRIQIFEHVLEGLMRRYRERVPDVTAIAQAMVGEGIIATPDHMRTITLHSVPWECHT